MAADDNHIAFPFEDPLSDSFGGFTMVKAPELTYGAVTEALLNGNFYSSMGPEIHGLSVEDGVLKVETSPVDKIFVMTQGRNCYREAAVPGQTISGGSFSLNGTEGYIRVQIRDREGRYACSNAYEMRGNTRVLRCYDMTVE